MSPILHYIEDRLARAYSTDEARGLARWLAEELTGKTFTELMAGHDVVKIRGLNGYIERLLAHEPIQYIFGKTEWMGLELRVTRDTLIPRPETGELVEWITSEYKGVNERLRVLDIGTGSGCIAIALKKQFAEWDVTAWDVSQGALEVARENARLNGLEIQFEQVDILRDRTAERFDIVVSNPPYVMEKEKETMEANVLQYEPQTALFVPDEDPLLFYRAIARRHLAPVLYFEINEQMGDAMSQMLREEGYGDIVIRKDRYGKDRMVKGGGKNG